MFESESALADDALFFFPPPFWDPIIASREGGRMAVVMSPWILVCGVSRPSARSDGRCG
jgi:hypothetical protein